MGFQHFERVAVRGNQIEHERHPAWTSTLKSNINWLKLNSVKFANWVFTQDIVIDKSIFSFFGFLNIERLKLNRIYKYNIIHTNGA